MSAKKEVYLLVKEIINEIPEIKHFDVWNDNVERDGEVTPFPVPAVFFEWTTGIWSLSTKGNVQNLDDLRPNQQGNLTFGLHIVIKKTNVADEDELFHYDIEELVYNAIHFKSFDPPEPDFIEGKIQRIGDDAILRHNVWRDWVVNYMVNVLECGTTGIDNDSVVDSQPVDFDVETELTIKNTEKPKPSLTINISE